MDKSYYKYDIQNTNQKYVSFMISNENKQKNDECFTLYLTLYYHVHFYCLKNHTSGHFLKFS